MNKVWLIIQREFLNRVLKKSFLITTILVPLIFPAIIGGLAYVAIKDAESAKPDLVHLLDESKRFTFENDKRFIFLPVSESLENAKKAYNTTDDFALLYIPDLHQRKSQHRQSREPEIKN
jgi:ABC-2 type transport system permease protein